MKKTPDERRIDTFGGADSVPNPPVAMVGLTASEWNAVCVAVHHGFAQVLNRKDVPVAVQSAFAADIENAMLSIKAQLKS